MYCSPTILGALDSRPTLVSVLANLIADNTQTYGGSFKVCFCSSHGFHAVETMLLVKPFRQYKQLHKLLGVLFWLDAYLWLTVSRLDDIITVISLRPRLSILDFILQVWRKIGQL